MTSLDRAKGERSTRSWLVNCTERIMLEDGYAAVTYRNVATKAGVSLGAVQHHFPSLDDLFLAVVRQYSERNLEMMVSALRDDPDHVLRVLWECSSDDLSSALFIEIMALVNHRKSIQAEITDFAQQYRKIQLEALTDNWDQIDLPVEGFSPAAVVFLLTCIPRWIRFEEAFGLSEGGADIKELVQRTLEHRQLAGGAERGRQPVVRDETTESPGAALEQMPPLGEVSRQAIKRAAASAKSLAHYTRMGWQTWATRRDDADPTEGR